MRTTDETTISTSALAKVLNMPGKDLFSLLVESGWIARSGDGWRLTKKGEFEGGKYVNSEKYGTYIAWPPDIHEHRLFTEAIDNTLLTASALGNRLGLSARHVNLVFLELGWIKKGIKGWELRHQGTQAGGIQMEYPDTGIPYVVWPQEIIKQVVFERNLQIIRSYQQINDSQELDLFDQDRVQRTVGDSISYQGMDGHLLHSSAESLLCNWLYMSEIVHSHKRRLPIEEEYYCDFYLPAIHLYLEIWGETESPKLLSQKLAKREVYNRYGLQFLELSEQDIHHLDDVLPKRLLKYGLAVY